MSILAIIPARGGSKGLPGKNIRPLGGKPLLAYSIEAALNCPLINRVVVSTESPEIASVAVNHGAEVPFLRQSELAGDRADLGQALQHMTWGLANRGYSPEITVVLVPTSPFRTAGLVERICRLLMLGHGSVQTVRAVPESEYYVRAGSLIHPASTVQPQSGGQMYRPYGLMSGDNRAGELPPYALVVRDQVMLIDIDNQDDFDLADAVLREGCFCFNSGDGGDG